jgi:hypothetical protein
MESFSSLLRPFRYSESRFVEQLTESPRHDSSWAASDRSLEGLDSSIRPRLVSGGRMTPRTKYPGGRADPADLCSDKCDNS